MKSIALDRRNAKILGRSITENGILRLIHSASSAEFVFTGKKLEITVRVNRETTEFQRNMPRIAILSDERFIVDRAMEKQHEKYTVIDSEEVVTRTVRIIKLSEAAFSVAEIYPVDTDNDAVIEAVPDKPYKIEFIGDSITCGYGIDDRNVLSDFSTEAENGIKSYAYLTARSLDADYSIFSYSGYGIISGWTSTGEQNTESILPPFYLSTGFSYSRTGDRMPADIPWNFENFKANAVVVNLGTNDISFCHDDKERCKMFEDEYVRFAETIRRCYPDAWIICSAGMMDDSINKYIENAVKRLSDEKVRFFRFTKQNGLLGFGSKWHPSEHTQKYAAEELSDFIRKEIFTLSK